MDKQVWQKMSTEILIDLKEWHRANPRATYVQIEDEVHKRVMQLEARLIQEAAEESPNRGWGRGSEHEAALCPKCATPLQARGKHKRTLQGNGGQSVTISRTYGTCPKCGEGPCYPSYQEYVEHWANAEFDRFVGDLEQVATVALESSRVDKATEVAFLKVARLEHDFWQMAWSGGEQ